MLRKTCYIVEDNPNDVNILKEYIERIGLLKLIGIGSTYSEAVSFLINTKPDIIFLDVELAGADALNGFDIIKTLPIYGKIIAISNHLDYAVKSYDMGLPSDFLLKPYAFSRFQLAVNRAISGNNPFEDKEERHIYLKVGRSFQHIFLDKIEYIEAYGIYIKLYETGQVKPIVVNESIGSILPYLKERGFIRVHKSFIVNLSKIDSFDANYIIINGRSPIPLGRAYRPNVDKFLRVMSSLDN